MGFIKRLFRKAAIIVVTIYAKHLYEQGVKGADLRHAREGKMIYLASQTFHPDRLVTYDKEQFKAEKKVFGTSAQLLTINTLRHGCYYHTPDRFGRMGLSEQDKEIRRKAFIKERLHFAKLI